jgi:hypothetical protein
VNFIEAIKLRDAVIDASVSNPELAVKLERELHQGVLLAIATGEKLPMSLASIAHSTTVLELPR